MSKKPRDKKKTTYTQGEGWWAPIGGFVLGGGAGLGWSVPALFSGEEAFLLGWPLTILTGTLVGEYQRRKMAKVDKGGAQAMKRVDASVAKIEVIARSPLFSEKILARDALREARVAREEFLQKCAWLREVKESGVFNKSDIAAREREVSMIADGIFDVESSLKAYLREVENMKYNSQKSAELLLAKEMEELREIYTPTLLSPGGNFTKSDPAQALEN